MSDHENISGEMLNAFVDGELDAGEWESLAQRIEADPLLGGEVAALRIAKDRVRNAYAGLPAPAAAPRGRARPGRWAAAAAVFAAAGWFAHAWLFAVPELDPASAYVLANAPASIDSGHVLVHVSTGGQEALGRALDEVEDLLRAARREGRALEVEIVANRSGIDLLEARGAPAAKRIAALRARYANLSLVACGQTLRRLAAGGRKVDLLPGTRVAPSALDEVVDRLRSGWVYVRV